MQKALSLSRNVPSFGRVHRAAVLNAPPERVARSACGPCQGEETPPRPALQALCEAGRDLTGKEQWCPATSLPPSYALRVTSTLTLLLRAILTLACTAAWAQAAAVPGTPAILAQDPVEVQIVGADVTLFPTPGKPAVVTVRARKHTPGPVGLVCGVHLTEAGAGYSASPAVSLEVAGDGEWHETTLQVFAEARSQGMVTGRLYVRSMATGVDRLRIDQPLRVAQGACSYSRQQAVNFGSGPRAVTTICLENPHLRAEFIADTACLYALVPRETGQDLLVEGDLPLGLLWFGTGRWFWSKPFVGEKAACCEFRTTYKGRVLRFAALLGDDDSALRLALDAGDLNDPPPPLCLATSRSRSRVDEFALSPGAAQFGAIPDSGWQCALPRSEAWSLGLWIAEADRTLTLSCSTAQPLGVVQVRSAPAQHNLATVVFGSPVTGTLDLLLSCPPGKRL